MPQIRPKNLSTTDGYSAYLDEKLDILLSPEEFVNFIREKLHKSNRFYSTYLANATCISSEKRILLEIELCYADRTKELNHQQDELCAQIAKDEEKAMIYLSDIHSKELDYEDMLLREATIQIYEFFGPDYNDGLFDAETTAELDNLLASLPRYEKQRSICNNRRRNNAYYKRRLRKKASTAKKSFVRRLDRDFCPSGNCAGLIVNQPSLATIKANRIWKRARKNGYVSGEIYPPNGHWRIQLRKHRKFYYVNPKK